MRRRNSVTVRSPLTVDHSRLPVHAPFHVSRFTFHVSRFTFHVSRLTVDR